jgi:NADPH-dependent 2,4-dienoyl-CoA reductase/sulfur reductase-like enzyme
LEKKRFVIIGGVAAGMSAASRIRSLNPDAEIQVFERSGYVSYAACGMPYLIAGKVPSSNNLVTYDARFFKEKRNIDVFLQHEAINIQPSEKTVLVRNLANTEERTYSYDRLLVSTGARPVKPPIKGADLKGIFTLRLLEQGIALKDYITHNSPGQALIVGAGNVGMEMAEAFSEIGLSVTMVEKMPNILGSMDDEINQVVEDELKGRHVTLIKSKAVVEFIAEGSTVKGATLEGGESVKVDIALIGAGIKPNSEIAGEAGIELGQSGAIKVNDLMETSIPHIYAAGDCAEAYHLIYRRNVYMPLGTTANKQGRVAGGNMAGGNIAGGNLAGGNAAFAGIIGTSVFKVFDLEVGRTGITEKEAKREGLNYISNTIEQSSRAHYYPGAAGIRIKLLAERQTGRLLGAQLVGKEGVSKRVDVFATAITAGMTAHDVENLDLGYAPPFAPVYDPVLIAASELQKKSRLAG